MKIWQWQGWPYTPHGSDMKVEFSLPSPSLINVNWLFNQKDFAFVQTLLIILVKIAEKLSKEITKLSSPSDYSYLLTKQVSNKLKSISL